MPRIGFVSAIFISIALIGGAMWFRFVRIPPYEARLISVQQDIGQVPEDPLLENFLSTGATLPATSTKPLTKTDILGRELFSDYMALKSQGQVTESNINTLAEKYAQNITSFDVAIQQVSLNQIIVVPNSDENLTTYGETLKNIYNKYKNLVANQYKNSGDITDIGGPAFSTFMSAIGKLYHASANELLLVRVPMILAKNHMDLVNNYLESAKIMESIGNTPKDPVQALAALNIYAKNSKVESELFLDIQKTMMANGIIWSNGI